MHNKDIVTATYKASLVELSNRVWLYISEGHQGNNFVFHVPKVCCDLSLVDISVVLRVTLVNFAIFYQQHRHFCCLSIIFSMSYHNLILIHTWGNVVQSYHKIENLLPRQKKRGIYSHPKWSVSCLDMTTICSMGLRNPMSPCR